MLMEIFMKVNGETTRLTVTDLTLMLTVQLMWANGLTTNNMAKVLRPGQMELSVTDSTLRARSTVAALLHSRMDLFTSAISK